MLKSTSEGYLDEEALNDELESDPMDSILVEFHKDDKEEKFCQSHITQ